MKKFTLLALVVLVAGCLALVGCASGGGTTEAEEPAEQENTQIPNPWSDVESLDEAVEIAGFDAEVNEAPETSLDEPIAVHYRAMEGIIDVTYEYPACEVTVRKGDPSFSEEGDISGDYGEYSNSWTETVESDDLEVSCFGNDEGRATKACWSNGDYDYALTAVGLGGDENFGVSADDLAAFVDALK